MSLISVSLGQIAERTFGDRYASRCWYIKKQKFLHKVYQSEDKAVVSIMKIIMIRLQRRIIFLTVCTSLLGCLAVFIIVILNV